MKIGIVGLGSMGAAMARRVEQSEHELRVWNRSPGRAEEFSGRGIEVGSSPRELLEWADVCVTILADGAALNAVAADLFAAPLEGSPAIWVEMSTIDPAASAELSAQAESAGVAYLRAPVSGNPGVVAAGNLTIIVSGPESALEQARPALLAIGPNLFQVGTGDQARTMKLALNLMLAATMQVMAEALAMGEAAELDRATMLEVMGASALGSPFVKYKTEALIADDYTSTFSAKLLAKDLDLIVAAANADGVPVPLAAAVRQVTQSAIGAGMGELDLSALVPLARRDAGLTDSLPE